VAIKQGDYIVKIFEEMFQDHEKRSTLGIRLRNSAELASLSILISYPQYVRVLTVRTPPHPTKEKEKTKKTGKSNKHDDLVFR
jgi:hypothetical protein